MRTVLCNVGMGRREEHLVYQPLGESFYRNRCDGFTVLDSQVKPVLVRNLNLMCPTCSQLHAKDEKAREDMMQGRGGM